MYNSSIFIPFNLYFLILFLLFFIKSSDLDDRDPAADLFPIADVGRTARRIVKCNKDTLNTPYKAGLTSGIDTGTAIISMGSVNYGVIFYLPDGGAATAPYICKKTNGTWGDWIRLTTNADIYYASTNVENNYNNYISGGLYQITGAVATNSPTGQAGSGGILIVFEAQAYVIQFAFNLTTAYYRRYTKSTVSWSAWKTFTSN